MSNPVNQFILGDTSYMDDIDTQIAKSKMYQQKLMQLKEGNGTPIWDKIDAELNTLSIIQQKKLLDNSEYATLSNSIQGIIWNELVKLVKQKVENNNKDILSKQLDLITKLKAKIIEEDNRDISLFNEFKEYSKTHPNATYNEFLKSK